MPADEAHVLVRGPRPDGRGVIVARQHRDEPVEVPATERHQVAVARGTVEAVEPVHGRPISDALVDDRRPEPMHLAEVPDEIGDVPVGATRHAEFRIGDERGGVENVALATDRVEMIHRVRCSADRARA